MDKTFSQIFEMKSGILCYDSEKSILLCKEPKGEKNRWVKKIDDVKLLGTVLEDPHSFYLPCESGETQGYLLAIDKSDGSTKWFIPGRAYFQIVYDENLFAIFSDERNDFYLLKVDPSDGTKIWHRRVGGDLCEYSFRSDRILLKYSSGKTEKISPVTGAVIT